MKEITLETKIADLLNDYEGMKDILIKINPKFKKLNNPVLRRTLAKIAGVRQAAVVGGMDPMDLLNQLRVAVGQTPVEVKAVEKTEAEKAPEWIANEPKESIDANELLDKEENPLAKSYNILRKMQNGEILQITSDFKPEPLIEEFEKNGHQVFSQEVAKDKFVTYVQK
ncbi:DUF1858 domain-containing protein [Sulfurimonas paralvinellae]|uniref:DUF1858 domain-containing protein n=1 Tax=Sulfurimonas paralvinellae TaxID=317658 RepID=A0A7M1B9S8_9BACT|nr:DUF1858 domain-containing protein [Sulfurimonas paralvinellae]QOP46415.1 DUF1858 domain-containing protein [Sulfurimonas paralvinellae]